MKYLKTYSLYKILESTLTDVNFPNAEEKIKDILSYLIDDEFSIDVDSYELGEFQRLPSRILLNIPESITQNMEWDPLPILVIIIEYFDNQVETQRTFTIDEIDQHIKELINQMSDDYTFFQYWKSYSESTNLNLKLIGDYSKWCSNIDKVSEGDDCELNYIRLEFIKNTNLVSKSTNSIQ